MKKLIRLSILLVSSLISLNVAFADEAAQDLSAQSAVISFDLAPINPSAQVGGTLKLRITVKVTGDQSELLMSPDQIKETGIWCVSDDKLTHCPSPGISNKVLSINPSTGLVTCLSEGVSAIGVHAEGFFTRGILGRTPRLNREDTFTWFTCTKPT
jgi:hypothetical protein